jgi:hypothetical protein
VWEKLIVVGKFSLLSDNPSLLQLSESTFLHLAMALSDNHSHNIKELNKELAPTTLAQSTENLENNELTSMMEFVPPAEGTPAAAALQGQHSFTHNK